MALTSLVPMAHMALLAFEMTPDGSKSHPGDYAFVALFLPQCILSLFYLMIGVRACNFHFEACRATIHNLFYICERCCSRFVLRAVSAR
jgi:hypothetical protein